MATTDKNFRIKNGLNVAGSATFQSSVILGTTPLRFDTASNKLQIQLDNAWVNVALATDIPDLSEEISFMDLGLAIDYNGEPIYTVQANGVDNSSTTGVASGGDPSTSSFQLVFDSGSIA